MTRLRPATPKDISQIRQIEEEFYGKGFGCPEETLMSWIETLPENFIVAEDEGRRIVGFVFFEHLDKIRPVPFVHEPGNDKNGKYAYVPDVGIPDEFRDSGVLQALFHGLVDKAKRDGCRTVVWLTGSSRKHDKIELEFLKRNGFAKTENVMRWEASPGNFVDDHAIWTKEI